MAMADLKGHITLASQRVLKCTALNESRTCWKKLLNFIARTITSVSRQSSAYVEEGISRY